MKNDGEQQDNMVVQGTARQPGRHKGESEDGAERSMGDYQEEQYDEYGEQRHRSMNDYSFRSPTHVNLGQYRGDTCQETFLAKFENLSEYLQ
jgi:hypothetical protein